MKARICDICGSPIYSIRRYRVKTILVAGDEYIKDICRHCWDDITDEIIKRRKQKNEDDNR